MVFRVAVIWAILLLGVLTSSPVAQVQPPATGSVWSGVYTAAQADRGKAVYASHCARCHGDDLGSSRAYPLAGEGFMTHWELRTLDRLFRQIRDTMPLGEPPTVSDSDKRDALAFLLQQNGFPAGSAELSSDGDQLAAVITRKTGPGALKTGAVVRVAGCLAQRENEWELRGATEPERTTLDATPAGDRQADASGSATRTVRLLNAFPSPAAHLGRTVQATGFLVRESAGDAVN